MTLRRLLAFTALLAFLLPARAHEVRPAYLEITEDAAHGYALLWKQPAMGEMAVRLVPHLSNDWLEEEAVETHTAPGFLIRRWQHAAAAPDALEGVTLTIEGLEQTITDVLLSATLADGRQIRTILKPDQPTLRLHFRAQGLPEVSAYLRLGIDHILTGFDHLMFVFGLLLLVKGHWRLVRTITAFTVAHSITLAATALGLIRLHPPLVESLVALSIVFLAIELVRACRGEDGLTLRQPWLIAFSFGLLHGFAFAGALADIGLPPNDIPLSLLLFNLGVEIGQLIFVVGALLAIAALQRLPYRPPPWLRWVPPYAIGSCAAFWWIERMQMVFI